MKIETALIAIPVLLAQLLGPVHAQAPPSAPPHKGGCIELTTVAELAKTVTAADGSTVKQYVPATRIVPGTEVTWTTTARNVCRKPAEKVVIDQPVPEHMLFVADSPTGDGTVISLSTDGHEFKAARDLTVRGSDGATRAAGAADVRAVRWALTGAIAPQSSVSVRYRATLE